MGAHLFYSGTSSTHAEKDLTPPPQSATEFLGYNVNPQALVHRTRIRHGISGEQLTPNHLNY